MIQALFTTIKINIIMIAGFDFKLLSYNIEGVFLNKEQNGRNEKETITNKTYKKNY